MLTETHTSKLHAKHLSHANTIHAKHLSHANTIHAKIKKEKEPSSSRLSTPFMQKSNINIFMHGSFLPNSNQLIMHVRQ